MKRLMLVAGLVIGLSPGNLLAATISLHGGAFFGPGSKGVHPFPDGAIHNVTLTGFLTGFIPFFNNGPEPPNVLGEVLQGGPVDGRLSDGTLINENNDGAFVLDVSDPKTGESARMLVATVEGGPLGGIGRLQPDPRVNLTLTLDVAFDPGPNLVVRSTVMFTTGAVEIPLSLKTRQGLPGGEDQAGPFPAGRVFIGRLGDFDRDGFLDGTLVLSRNAPLELVVGRGDPVLQLRPWTSDVPVTPLDATLLTLSGIVQNFPEPVQQTVRTGEIEVALGYLADIAERVDAALANVRAVLRARDLEKSQQHLVKEARELLLHARGSAREGIEAFATGDVAEGVWRVTEEFGLTGAALQLLLAVRGDF